MKRAKVTLIAVVLCSVALTAMAAGRTNVALNTSNSYGQLLCLTQQQADGTMQQTMTFVDPENHVATLTRNSQGYTLNVPGGGMAVKHMSEGLQVTLWANPTDRLNERECTFVLNPHTAVGAPVLSNPAIAAVQAQMQTTAQKVFSENIQNFAQEAGLASALNSLLGASSASSSLLQGLDKQSIQPEGLAGCLAASAAMGLALAAFIAEPVDPLAWWCFAAADASAQYDCSN